MVNIYNYFTNFDCKLNDRVRCLDIITEQNSYKNTDVEVVFFNFYLIDPISNWSIKLIVTNILQNFEHTTAASNFPPRSTYVANVRIDMITGVVAQK